MVEAINNVNTTPKKGHVIRNTAIASVVGLPVGYIAGAAVKKIYKNGDFTDEFMKEFGNIICDSNPEEYSADELKMVKQGIALGENPSIEEVREYITKCSQSNPKIKQSADEFLKKSDAEIMEEFKISFDPIFQRIKKAKALIKPIFEEHKTFCYKSDSKLGAVLDAQKAELLLRHKAGKKCGVLTGVILGIVTFLLSKFSNNKNNNQ